MVTRRAPGRVHGGALQENVSKFFQSWVEDTKKMDLAKVKDGYAGEA